MLAAVAFSAERLLLAADWRDAIDDVLGISVSPRRCPGPT